MSALVSSCTSISNSIMYRKRRDEGREMKEKEKEEMRGVCKALGIACGPQLSM